MTSETATAETTEVVAMPKKRKDITTTKKGQDVVPAQEAAQPAPMSEAVTVWAMIDRASRDPAVDIEKFERLIAMRDRYEARDTERRFNDAVAAAKGEIPPIVKNREVDFTTQKGRTRYKHEDLAEIAKTIDPILSRHGLSYRFRSEQNGSRVTITCILSGHGYREETSLSAGEDHTGNKNDHQAVSSAATYLQRYTLKIALGLAASNDDDDGQAAGAGATISDEQAMAIVDMLEAKGSDRKAFCAYFKIATVADLQSKDFDRAISALKKKSAAQ